jgi:hypothetical protein
MKKYRLPFPHEYLWLDEYGHLHECRYLHDSLDNQKFPEGCDDGCEKVITDSVPEKLSELMAILECSKSILKMKGGFMGPEIIELEDALHALRDDLTPMIAAVKGFADDRPRSGAEITLGLRKLQEARMWLGVAEAMERGLDPWANKIEVKE